MNFKNVLVTMAGVCLALTSARAVPIVLSVDPTSPDVLGIVYPAQPTGAAADVSYINAMIGLGLNGETTVSGNLVWRSENPFTSLPTATTVGDASGTAASFTDTGYTYLAVNYGSGANGGVEVWDIGSITASSIIDIPTTADGLNLSGWTVLDAQSSSKQTVPDGGSTALLLGIALFGGYLARRHLSSGRA